MDPGSMDPDLLDRHPNSFSPSLCAERENSQYAPTGRTSSTCKTKQKLSLKQHCSPTMQTSPKLSQDSDCETSQKSQQDVGDTRPCRGSSMLVSPASKMSSTPDYVSPTDQVREQVRSGNTSQRPTPRTSQKQSRPGDLGEVHHSDSPTEIGHPAEKPQFITGKKDSGKTGEAGMEESPRCVPNTNSEVLDSGLPGDTESTLSADATASCHLAANLQMQSDSGSSDNLKSDTTYLSSDKVVLATTDASNDTTPPIRVPYASSFKSSKKMRKKSHGTKTPDLRKTAPAGHDDILQNYVDASHEQDKDKMYQDKSLQDKGQCKEMVVDKDGNSPTHESDNDSDVECIEEIGVSEDISDRRGKGQTGDSVVMETMSCKSNFSKESGESSSVLLSCISPTWREDANLGRRVNCTTRNSTQTVNKKILIKGEKCNVGQKSSGWEQENKETDSDGTDASVEEFSCDIQESDRTMIVEAQAGSACSQEKHRQTQKKSCKNADAMDKINLHRQPPGGCADNAKPVQTIAIVPDVSQDSDSSSKINLLSVSKCCSGPRRRISARRSLWSQSSAESRNWPKSSQSTAASTPLIPLVKTQSHVGVDLEKAETFERLYQRCISDKKTDFPEENLEDTTIGRGRYEMDRRVQDPKKRESHERRLGEKDEEEGRWNEGDVCYSEMSTVDCAVMSCDEEDLSDHSNSPKKRSRVSESQLTHVTRVEPTSDRSCTRRTRKAEKGTGKSQTHSADCTFSDCCHDNLLNGEQARHYINMNSPGSSDDDGDASCNLQNSYHSDHVTCDENENVVIDDDTDDVNSTLSEKALRTCDLDTTDVDDFVLPTPQKQKPILKVAMEIHSIIMDASDDDEPPSPKGNTRAVRSCDSVDRNADVNVKTETKGDDNVMSHTRITTCDIPPDGSTEPIQTQPVTPMGNPSKFVTALPTTPVPACVGGGQGSWE